MKRRREDTCLNSKDAEGDIFIPLPLKCNVYEEMGTQRTAGKGLRPRYCRGGGLPELAQERATGASHGGNLVASIKIQMRSR